MSPDDRERITRSRAYPSDNDLRAALNPADASRACLSTINFPITDQRRLDDMRKRRSAVQEYVQESPAVEIQANRIHINSSLQPARLAPAIPVHDLVADQHASISQYVCPSERGYPMWVSPPYSHNRLSYPSMPTTQPWFQDRESDLCWDDGRGNSLSEFQKVEA